MKKLVFVCLLCVFIAAFAVDGKRIEDYSTGLKPWEQKELDSLFDKLSAEIYESFVSIPQTKLEDEEGEPIKNVGMWQFKDDIGDKFYNRFRQKVTNHPTFRLYERKDIQKSLEELGLQNSDMYSKEDRLKIGNLKQWNGLIYGKVTLSAENILGKRKIYLNVDCNFDNIESGQVVWAKTFSDYFKPQLPLLFFLIGIGVLFGLTIGLNIASKGRHVSKMIGFFIVFSVLFSIWFYVL